MAHGAPRRRPPEPDTEVACPIVRQPGAEDQRLRLSRNLSPNIGREVVLVSLAEDASFTAQLVATGEPVRPFAILAKRKSARSPKAWVEEDWVMQRFSEDGLPVVAAQPPSEF